MMDFLGYLYAQRKESYGQLKTTDAMNRNFWKGRNWLFNSVLKEFKKAEITNENLLSKETAVTNIIERFRKQVTTLKLESSLQFNSPDLTLYLSEATALNELESKFNHRLDAPGDSVSPMDDDPIGP